MDPVKNGAAVNNQKRRRRNWVFTHNNYNPDEMPIIKDDDSKTVLWLRYGQEVGEGGTPHLQGCCMFRNQVSLKQVREYFSDTMLNCHWEFMLGSIQANVDYTGKDASEEEGTLHEYGTRPLTNPEKRAKGAAATKERYIHIMDLARKGNFCELEANYPGDFFRSYKRIKELHTLAVAKGGKKDVIQDAKKQHWWIHGEAGSGKTSAVWELFGDDLYLKAQNKWWDNWTDQEWTLMDDFHPSWVGKNQLKQWADRYPCAVETKGGCTTIRPRHMVLTSNYKIDECDWNDKDEAAIKRRFQQCNAKQFKELWTQFLKEKRAKEAADKEAAEEMIDMSDSEFI